MKNKYNKKNTRKFKIISLSLGIASLTSVVAIVTPLVIQKNSSLVNNSFSSNSNSLNTNFAKKTNTNFLSNTTAINSLENYNFPLLNTNNEVNITSSNIQNLYNINGSSIMYAQSKGASNSNNNNIDSIVSINQANNNINWVVDSTSLIAAVNKSAVTNDGEIINTIFNFNKMVYSAATTSVFLDLYVGNTAAPSTGYTVIVQINIGSATNSAIPPTVSNYFNASTTTNGTSNNSIVLGSFKNDNFSQFVIQADGQSPTLHLIKSKYTQADATAGSSQYNLISFTVLNNNIQGGSGSSSGGTTNNSGVIIRTPLTTLSSSDVQFLQENSNNALYVTNSFWSSGGPFGGLVVILSRNSISALNNYATMYSFAASTSTFLNAPSSQVLDLNYPQFKSNQPVMLNFETIGSNLFLIGSQKNDNATSSAFNSNGSIVALQISININGNNASISLTTYSNNNLSYGNGQQILGIVNVLNTNNLPSASQYIALTSNGALVILDSKFNYLNELATIPNSFFPTGVSVLKLITNGLNYLVYLSNGSIVVFNNTGYLGYLSNISLNSNNTIQSISPISFIQQQNVVNGVAIFTQPLAQFISNITSSGNQSIFSLINTSNRSLNYLVQTKTVTNTNTLDPYSAQVTLNIYQQLTMVNSQGISVSSEIVSTVFLGSHTYNIYNKVGTITANPITSLPTSLQNILASSITTEQVLQYLLVINNIDTTDLYSNGNNNISLTLTPNDSTGTLAINIAIGSYWTNSGLQQSATLSFTINGFLVGPSTNQLSYTLDPTSITNLESKYGNVSSDTLTNADVLLDFIKLSPYLAGLQGTTIAIVPNIVTGTATITITFNFSNPSFILPANSSASLVTQNSITWTTPAIFLTNPTINSSILFNFNSSQFIATNFPQTINNLPSAIGTIINAMQSLTAKVQWLIDKGFINASEYVQSHISNITIVTGQSSDFTGSFSLLIEFNIVFPNSVQTTYLYNYSGFAQNVATASSIYTVTNLSKEAYNAQFSTGKPFNSIFSVEPSLITKTNIINTLYQSSTNTNQLSGYLVILNNLAASSQYTINLVPDDSSGSLLITIVFSNYIELSSENKVQNVKNKTFVFTYYGFKTSNNVQQFSLNWKSPNQLDAQLLTLLPSDVASNFTLKGTTSIDQLEMFADLSQSAINLYQNNQLINIQYVPNDLNGSIVVNAVLANWSGSLAPQIFSQEFSGFLIPPLNVKNTIEAFNPFVNDSEQILTKLKASVPSTIGTQQWLSLFNFSTTILNPLEKVIYVVYNDQTGYVSFVLFAKPNNINSVTPTSPVAPINSVIENNISPKFVFLQEATSGTVTPSNSSNGINFSDVPISQLTSQGFVEMKNSSQKLISGFKQSNVIYNTPNNVLSIILASVIPTILFIPIILYLTISKNKKAIKSVRAKISKRLEEEYNREKELDEDDK